MAELPDPPLPATVNLRDYPTMPLDVARLRDSDMSKDPNPEGFRCAVLAWCVAWHQVPASSLPDDDRALAGLIGIGRTPRAVKEWQSLREVALRGFVKCSDGRLYHGVVAEMAILSWGRQLKHRWMTACAAIRKRGQRKKEKVETPDFSLWITSEHPEAIPFMSRWTKHRVTEDTDPGPEGHPPPVTDTSNVKQHPREVKGREVKNLPIERCTGDGDISPPPAAASPAATPNPDHVARVVAECARAKLDEPFETNAIVARWIRNGATLTQITTALADARKSMPFPKILKAGYVDTILISLMEADRTARRQAEAKVQRTTQQIAEQRAAAEHATAPPPGLIEEQLRKAKAA